MTTSDPKKVPPDGGYGWIVTFAYALNNIVVLPLIAGFGLVFKEAFDDCQISHTQGTLIITLNHGIGMLLCFFGGPVLKKFGYRKVAVFGAICIAGGLMLTSVGSSFWVFIISYSIINAMGIAAVMAAFNLAINSFFKEKRSRAIGAGMSLTGLGTIAMPLLMSALMSEYGWRYAVLILGAMCLHSLAAALLLRPAKWYLKDAPVCEEMVPLNKVEDTDSAQQNCVVSGSSKQNGANILPPKYEEVTEIEGKDGKGDAIDASVRSLASTTSIQARNAAALVSASSEQLASPPRIKWWESQEINLGSSINIFNEAEKNKTAQVEPAKEIETSKTISQKIVDFFDLTLLKDPIFVNILIGLSLASCVETNFSLLLPIILGDTMHFTTDESAYIMAVIGLTDTMFRLVSPFIAEWCHTSSRYMYLVALMLIIFTRTIMLYATTFWDMVLVAIGIGVTKGVRTVYMNVIIPNYVPLERLPFASGIQMLVNGVIIISIGSLLGRLREASGSYAVPIILLNVVTFITVILWSAEFIYFRLKGQKSPETMAAC